MTIESEIFKKSCVDFKKLVPFGFKRKQKNYYYETLFMQNSFKAAVTVDSLGRVKGEVFDIENNEIFYPLRIKTLSGAYTGLVREEYTKILNNIREKCCVKNHFIYPQSNRITNFILQTYGDEPLFMWEKYDDTGVFKNPSSKKWYGIIMNIDHSKLDKTKTGEIEIINIKLDEAKIKELLKQKGYYPAWHMNKRTWISICLNETIKDKEITDLIKESHNFSEK